MTKLSLNFTTYGWQEETKIDTATTLDETTTYAETDDSTLFFILLFGEESAKSYSAVGTRISESIPLEETNKRYRITWKATIPVNTSITVETNVSLDSGTTWLGWKTVKNNQFIPDIDNTTDLTLGLLQIKQTLQSSDVDTTPVLESVMIIADNSDDLSVKENWQTDSIILAKFVNTLESGNIGNDGVNIVKFRIVRRELNQDQTEDIQLGEVEYLGGNADLEYVDGSVPNRGLIYSIIPVGENDLDGAPREVTIEDNVGLFNGVWIYDKDTQETLVFDKAVGSMNNIESSLIQSRTIIETFAPHPQTYYSSNTAYHQFTLTSTFLPEEWERSGNVYMNILNKFIKQHKSFLVKMDNGLTMVCDISNPRVSQPPVTWSGYDYVTISVDVTEVDSVENYMKGES